VCSEHTGGLNTTSFLGVRPGRFQSYSKLQALGKSQAVFRVFALKIKVAKLVTKSLASFEKSK